MSYTTKMIDTILIDDEEDSLDALQEAIDKYCHDLSVKGKYTSPEEALTAIKTLKPNLVFLDVQMPGMCGI